MSVKVTHSKNATRIHLTGADADSFFKSLAKPTAPTIYMGPPVTVTFKDEGQDFLEWDIRDGHVVACRPFQAAIWVGREVHSTPIPRKQLQITGHDGALTWIKYPLTKVKALAEQDPEMPSKAVRNSKVVTAGAKALLAAHKTGGRA
jgi:hypothetical protein